MTARSRDNLRPVSEGNQLAVTHGATSERHVRPLARNHRRRLLRQIGLRGSDLDGLGRAYLDNYCRAAAKIELIDRYLADRGLLDGDGNVPGCMKLYVSLLNSCRLALSKLEDHLRHRGDEPSIVAVLQGNARRIEGNGT